MTSHDTFYFTPPIKLDAKKVTMHILNFRRPYQPDKICLDVQYNESIMITARMCYK